MIQARPGNQRRTPAAGRCERSQGVGCLNQNETPWAFQNGASRRANRRLGIAAFLARASTQRSRWGLASVEKKGAETWPAFPTDLEARCPLTNSGGYCVSQKKRAADPREETQLNAAEDSQFSLASQRWKRGTTRPHVGTDIGVMAHCYGRRLHHLRGQPSRCRCPRVAGLQLSLTIDAAACFHQLDIHRPSDPSVSCIFCAIRSKCEDSRDGILWSATWSA